MAKHGAWTVIFEDKMVIKKIVTTELKMRVDTK